MTRLLTFSARDKRKMLKQADLLGVRLSAPGLWPVHTFGALCRTLLSGESHTAREAQICSSGVDPIVKSLGRSVQLVSACAVCNAPSTAEGQELFTGDRPKPMGKQFTQGHAVLVGVGSDLPNTVDDAKGIAAILRDPGRCAYPDDQVHCLTDEAATRDGVLTAIETVSNAVDADATVVVYFSGHGYRIGKDAGARYYLMPYGYDVEKLDSTAISGSEFTEALRSINSQKLLLLLDCCHAGGLDDAKAPGLQIAKAHMPRSAKNLLAEGSGRAVIASSKEDELSFAGKPYSAFTLALVEALSGAGLAKQDGLVRITDLMGHTREMVPQRTKNRQHPVFSLERADDFAIAYYAGGDEKPKSLEFQTPPIIEPNAGAWTNFDQRNQTVTNQVNLSGGTVGFVQPGWTVHGDVNQVGRDMYVNKGPGQSPSTEGGESDSE